MLTSTPFSVGNEASLRRLFQHLGVEWSEDPAVNAETAQQLWLGGEHGQNVIEYPPALLEGVIPFGAAMGMIDATLPEFGTIFDETCIIGGTLNANVRRYELINYLRRCRACQFGPIVGWYGQRLRQKREGTVDQLVARLQARDPALLDHSWVVTQLELDDADPNPWQRPFATEFELGIAAALLEFGPLLHLTFTHRIEEPARVPGVPGRTILWQGWTGPNDSSLLMLNSAAVPRKMQDRPSDPRHTTASSAKEWLEILTPFTGRHIGVVSGNPHTERTIRSVLRQFKQLGYDDLIITPMGTNATDADKVVLGRTILGEVARLLGSEQREVG